ncbi:MAG TPA: hypothetical protein VLV55_00950 [Rhizomicrobium sp.]|nr:hypothetical protein [Rhizomicrobium sp.]
MGKWSEDLDQIWQFLRTGIELPLDGRHPLELSLRDLTAPHLAVLVHKRGKLAAEADAILSGKWLGELADFSERIVRFLEIEWQADRRRIVGLLDDIIAEEQHRQAEEAFGESVPVTGRFDMRWAH